MFDIVTNRFGFYFYFASIPQPRLSRTGGTAAACQA
jgi:hypothetical protein